MCSIEHWNKHLMSNVHNINQLHKISVKYQIFSEPSCRTLCFYNSYNLRKWYSQIRVKNDLYYSSNSF